MKESSFWFCKFKIPKKDSLGKKKNHFFGLFGKVGQGDKPKNDDDKKENSLEAYHHHHQQNHLHNKKEKGNKSQLMNMTMSKKHHECTLYTTYLDCILMLA
jgi:hypothetical protein